MIYFLQIVLIRHIFWSVNVPIRLGWWKLYHSIFWWWPIMWKKFFLLIWNGTSWNTENCWNFWPNCFGLWGISFWKRKNGSETPCTYYPHLRHFENEFWIYTILDTLLPKFTYDHLDKIYTTRVLSIFLGVRFWPNVYW